MACCGIEYYTIRGTDASRVPAFCGMTATRDTPVAPTADQVLAESRSTRRRILPAADLGIASITSSRRICL
jgi:hypothetical protein